MMFSTTSKINKALVCLMCLGVAITDTSCLRADSVAEQISKDFTAVAKHAIPAVVSIQVKIPAKQSTSFFGSGQDNFEFFGNEDFFQRFFGTPRNENKQEQQQTVGQASGFIISQDGNILTNSHVVRDATEISVILNDGREFKGKLVGVDPNTDVALVKIEADNLSYLKLANSDDVEIGQWAIAIGNPLGLQASLTVGVISAKGRYNLDLASIEDFLQTDAAINRGNSGGPLLNIDGEVMGMNTAIVANMGTGGYMGIGFAIPSNILNHVVEQLLKTGSVTRGFLGITLQAIDSDLAQAFGLKNLQGALVADVSKGSPAEKAGLKQGDVIQTYNHKPVTNMGALRNAIALMSPGTRVTLTVLREGKTVEIPVVIGEYPTTTPVAAVKNDNQLGFEVQDLTPDLGRSLGLTEDKGVVITKVDPNSAAAWAGLKKGAIISAINQKRVETVEQFNTVLKDMPHGRPVLLLIKQGDAIRFISLKVG